MIGWPSLADGGLHGELLDLGVEILFFLVAFAVEVLLEVALIVKQAEGDHRHAEAAGALDMVTRQDAESAGVNGTHSWMPNSAEKYATGLAPRMPASRAPQVCVVLVM